MKKLIIKISITLGLLIFAIVIISFTNKNEIAKEEGTFQFTLIDKNNITIYDDTIVFKEGDSLLGLLDEKYGVRYENGQFGAVVFDIGSVKTDFYTTYLAIYVDDEYSSMGISNIKLVTGMRVKIVEVIL